MPTRDELPPCPDPRRYTLNPLLADLDLQRILNKMVTLWRTGFKNGGQTGVPILKELDLQNDYPLRKLLRSGFQWQHDKENAIFRFRIQIPDRNGALLRRNKQANGYRFILLLVYGNTEQEGSLRLKSMKSEDYTFAGTGVASECLLELPYTPEPGQWIFCLRAEALEEGRVASHPRSKGLLILDGGRWE